MSTTARELHDELRRVVANPDAQAAERVGAFEAYFRQACVEGNSPDALSNRSPDEVERFWSRTVPGPDGHTYWTGGKSFKRNDGRQRVPRRWVWEHTTGDKLAPTTDVFTSCGEQSCVTFAHLTVGRSTSRQWYRDETIIGRLQVFAMRLGRTPSRNEWRVERLLPTDTVVARRFGSWSRFVRAAGLPPYVSQQEHEATYDDATLVQGLRELAALLGHPPTSQDWQRHRDWAKSRGYPTDRKTIQRRIGNAPGRGSWDRALKRAGVIE